MYPPSSGGEGGGVPRATSPSRSRTDAAVDDGEDAGLESEREEAPLGIDCDSLRLARLSCRDESSRNRSVPANIDAKTVSGEGGVLESQET